jgi:hypothetical protein
VRRARTLLPKLTEQIERIDPRTVPIVKCDSIRVVAHGLHGNGCDGLRFGWAEDGKQRLGLGRFGAFHTARRTRASFSQHLPRESMGHAVRPLNHERIPILFQSSGSCRIRHANAYLDLVLVVQIRWVALAARPPVFERRPKRKDTGGQAASATRDSISLFLAMQTRTSRESCLTLSLYNLAT